jgi:hypothetical protein
LRLACFLCLCFYMCIFPFSFRIIEPIFMTLGMYVMAAETISAVHFVQLSYQSVRLHVYRLLSLLDNGSVNSFLLQRVYAATEELLDELFSASSLSYRRKARYYFSCGGGIEYFHRSPSSRKRLRKGNPVPGVYLGHPVPGGYKYRNLAFQAGGISRIGTIKWETQTRAGLHWRGPAATVNYRPVLSSEMAQQNN